MRLKVSKCMKKLKARHEFRMKDLEEIYLLICCEYQMLFYCDKKYLKIIISVLELNAMEFLMTNVKKLFWTHQLKMWVLNN